MTNPLGTVRGKLAVSVLSLAVLAVVVGMAVFSAFSSTQATSINTFTAGTVALTSNGTATALFNLPNAAPGDSVSKCVQVTYTGTLNGSIKMYATQTGELGSYLNASITRGTFPGEAPLANSCTGFIPDAESSSLFAGKVSTLPTLAEPLSLGGYWAAGAVHVYEITVTLPTAAPEAAEGKSSGTSFTWQSQNS
jgi:predicted ribosomally synthesized peptide with SipW-like signal peptide